MDYYTFRREFDFATLFNEAIVQIKASRQFRKMSLAEKNEVYDSLYTTHRGHFLSGYVSEDEKEAIENNATQQIMNRGLEELEKTLQ
ncbi:hypothetical protein [Desulfosporosinus sp. SB140]|uniref:hypothetical protein n=1 Tax=Desulfosporosinus paludis TaxID=3115649 RepID=UPI00388F879F